MHRHAGYYQHRRRGPFISRAATSGLNVMNITQHLHSTMVRGFETMTNLVTNDVQIK